MSLYKKPKKGKVSKKISPSTETTTTETSAVSLKKIPSSKLTDKDYVNQIIAQALLRYKADQAQDKQIKFEEISHLALIAEEYLSSFVLLGYSLQNEKVVVFNLPTAKDESAMIDLLRTTFLNMVGNQG